MEAQAFVSNEVLVPPRDNMLLHETTAYVDLDEDEREDVEDETPISLSHWETLSEHYFTCHTFTR